MSSEAIIKAENITKIYKLYGTPGNFLKEIVHPLRKKYHTDFFALNNVSFEISKGDTVGIIGKNGSGKSTLLKVIAGVLTPTSGSVSVRGKISALLELGAGFNPEFSGYENIFFQGAIMGYSKKEMDEKIDGILAFADIGDFIYQPVKMYSSGMFVRLAFSMATQIDPDILIVDEALSVGDVAFQNKCMRRMDDIRSKGVTILFVSHDTQAVGRFCEKTIWMEKGNLKGFDASRLLIENYFSSSKYGHETSKDAACAVAADSFSPKGESFSNLIDVRNCDSFGEKKALIYGVGFFNSRGERVSALRQGERVSFVCEFYTTVDLYNVGIGVLLKDRLNCEITTFNSYMYGKAIESVAAETRTRVKIDFTVPKLYPHEYVVTVALSEGSLASHIQQHWIHSATKIAILSADNADACIVSLYRSEVEYSYEQI